MNLHLTHSAAYSSTEDLVSQLLTERLLLFVSNDNSHSLASPFVGRPTPIGSTPSQQRGREGMVAYLMDCYERICQEEHKVFIFFTLFSIGVNVCTFIWGVGLAWWR